MLNYYLAGYVFGQKANNDGTSSIQKQIVVYGLGPQRTQYDMPDKNGRILQE